MAVTLDNVKFSDIDLAFVKDYLRVDYDDDDIELNLYIFTAKSYIVEHSGVDNIIDIDGNQVDPISLLDKIGYSPILLLKIIADMYDNKSSSVDGSTKKDMIFEMLMSKIRSYNL